MFKHLSKCIVLIFLEGTLCSFHPKTYYMDQYCDDHVTVSKAIILRLTENGTESGRDQWECKVKVQAENIHQRLLILPLHLDIKVQFTCNDNALYILDTDDTPFNDPPMICGDHLSRDTFNTSGSYALFQYGKSAGITDIGQFSFLITAIKYSVNGTCPPHSFHCRNGLCLSQDLECNGYNNCADYSDEGGTCSVSTSPIVFISVGASLGVLFVVLVVAFLGRRVYRKRYESVQ